MDLLSEHIKETIDRVDGFITGTLIVDLEKSSVELEQTRDGKTTYLPLTDSDFIEVRTGKEYVKVTVKEALVHKDNFLKCSIFAGLYARVKNE
ncbi:hypothetical protein [Metabacillus litoralis]|uniref:hypothetical protein n=1 Tax=Metabacillus litoralis TaxID=152268 RepID=UPI00204014DE|nr:hypothetical protein [Metabacillus litoralis]MCM3411493.1 hypothetical protein [Metabacillus litoralis]